MKRMLRMLIILACCVGLFGGLASQSTASDKVTILVWDEFTEEAENAWIEKVIIAFEKAYPNVTVKREIMPLETMRDLIRTAIASGTGPDLFIMDVGPAYGGGLARADLLLPLDEAYQKYGWQIFNWAKETTMWKGVNYGMPQEVDFIGMYYNKKIFGELGLSPPQSHQDVLRICEVAKNAGHIPMIHANLPRWPASNVFSIYANYLVGKKGMDDILLRGASWNRPEIVKAVKLFFVDMNQKGYLPPDLNGISYQDGNILFWAGKGALYLTGSWMIGAMTREAEFEVGFMMYPPIEGKPTLAPASVGYGWFVPRFARHPKETLDFLDALFARDSLRNWVSIGHLPAHPGDTAGLKISSLLQDAKEVLTRGSVTGLGYNIDVYTPDNFNEAMYNGLQAVLNREMTAEQLVKNLQTEWETAIEQGKVELQK